MSLQEKQQVAFVSMLASAALTIGKFVAGLLSGSLALMGEALHSLLDFAATAMTWFAVRVSDKPADDEHHYGHGKVESIAALIEVGLLVSVAVWLLREGVSRLWGSEPASVHVTPLALAVVVISIVVDFFRARALKRTALATKSQALEADALHFQSDMWSSLIVLGGLVAVSLGFAQADALAALLVAGFILLASFDLGKRTVDALMDAAPEGLAALMRESALKVHGVIGVERVRVRPVGAAIFAEMLVDVPRTLPLERVTRIKEQILAQIAVHVPEAEVVVTTQPKALDDETILERIMLISASMHVLVHHVTVQQRDGRLCVAFDIEVDGRMKLEAAHTIATRIETALREEFGAQTEVETHIEPLEVSHLDGRSCDPAVHAMMSAHIATLIPHYAGLLDVHDVRVVETDKGRVLTMHCHADPHMSVTDIHTSVDQLERTIRTHYPDLVRLITHAEPPPNLQ